MFDDINRHIHTSAYSCVERAQSPRLAEVMNLRTELHFSMMVCLYITRRYGSYFRNFLVNQISTSQHIIICSSSKYILYLIPLVTLIFGTEEVLQDISLGISSEYYK